MQEGVRNTVRDTRTDTVRDTVIKRRTDTGANIVTAIGTYTVTNTKRGTDTMTDTVSDTVIDTVTDAGTDTGTEIHIETHTSQPENKEKECSIIDDSFEEEEHHETIEDDESMEEVIFDNGNAELVSTISSGSDCNKMIEPEPEKRAKSIKRVHPNTTMEMDLSEQPHPENKEWITVKGDAYLPFVEFGGRPKLYKCLSKACAQSKKLVANKGVNKNNFYAHCIVKHGLKIDSISRRTGEIISIGKHCCSKCRKEFSSEQSAKEHEEKCLADLRKGNS